MVHGLGGPIGFQLTSNGMVHWQGDPLGIHLVTNGMVHGLGWGGGQSGLQLGSSGMVHGLGGPTGLTLGSNGMVHGLEVKLGPSWCPMECFMGWGGVQLVGRIFEAGCLLFFLVIRVGAHSR